MRKVEVSVFSFNELSPSVQTKVLDKYRSYDNPLIDEDLRECFLEALELRGYSDPQVYWSLASCQGDGVAFTCKLTTDKAKSLAKKHGYPNEELDNLHLIQVEHDGRYYHSNSMKVSVVSNEESELSDKYNLELESKLLEDIQSLSRELERKGYKIIENLTSDDSIKSHIEANEIEFHEDGRTFIES